MSTEQEDDEAPAPAKAKVSRTAKANKPSKKSKKVDAETQERTRKYPESLKIKILNKQNPHREKSSRAQAFDALLKCKTMGDYYETGHKIKYIQAWIDAGLIEVG